MFELFDIEQHAMRLAAAERAVDDARTLERVAEELGGRARKEYEESYRAWHAAVEAAVLEVGDRRADARITRDPERDRWLGRHR